MPVGLRPTRQNAVSMLCNVRRRWFIGIAWGHGPFHLGSIPARAFGFYRVMTLSELCTYTRAIAKQAVHPLGIGKLVPGNLSACNNANALMRVW